MKVQVLDEATADLAAGYRFSEVPTQLSKDRVIQSPLCFERQHCRRMRFAYPAYIAASFLV